jgi:hypothetical protein
MLIATSPDRLKAGLYHWDYNPDMDALLALLAVFALLAAPGAKPAGCAGPSPTTISQAVAAGHEFVFKAKVFRVRPPLAGTGVVPVMFSVIHAYQGAPSQLLTVYFDPARDPRGVNFHPGDVMLISTRAEAVEATPGSKPAQRSVGNACTLRELVRVSH